MQFLKRFTGRCRKVSSLEPTPGEGEPANHSVTTADSMHQASAHIGDALIEPRMERKPGMQLHAPAPTLGGDALRELVPT